MSKIKTFLKDFPQLHTTIPYPIRLIFYISLGWLILYKYWLCDIDWGIPGAYVTGYISEKIAIAIIGATIFYFLNIHYSNYYSKRKLVFFINGRLCEIEREANQLFQDLGGMPLDNFPTDKEHFEWQCLQLTRHVQIPGKIPGETYEGSLNRAASRISKQIEMFFKCSGLESELIDIISHILSHNLYRRLNGYYFGMKSIPTMDYYSEDIFNLFSLVDQLQNYRLAHIKKYMTPEQYKIYKDKWVM